jgi:hypothetical protein
MRPKRSMLRLALLAGPVVAAAAPALAQYQYPPYQPPGQQRGRFAHACFPADQGGYLRIEWTASGRWAVFNWPPQSNLRIYIGDEPAQWCWSPRINELFRPCRPNPNLTKPVQPGC